MQRIPARRRQRSPIASSPTTESAIALVDDDTWYRFHRRRLDRPFDVARGARAVLPGARLRRRRRRLFAAKILQFFTSSDAAPARRVRADVVVGVPAGRRLLAEVPAPAARRPAHDGRDGSAARLGAHHRHDLDAAAPRLRVDRRHQRPHHGRADDARCGSIRGSPTCRRAGSSSTPASPSTASRSPRAGSPACAWRATRLPRRRLLRAGRADRRRAST